MARGVRRALLWGMLGLLALSALVGVALELGGSGAGTPAQAPALQLRGTEQPAEFARALAPPQLRFPEDHGPHLEYQTEWWYYVGNLLTAEGRHFGFQLTFFRRGLQPGEPDRPSSFAANHIYSAHLALTDTAGSEHRAWERYGRGALGLAGAQAEPYRVWLDDWSAQAIDADATVIRLHAVEQDLELDLTLQAEKGPVAHGEGGLSQKSAEPGNASIYVSFTRMTAEGRLSARGESFAVEGSAWFDHEWGTTALGPRAVGWDWFGLQLDDGRELMLAQIRRDDGEIEPASGGTLIEPDGEIRRLSAAQVTIEALGVWTSPENGAAYPSGWRLRIPEAALELELRPRIEDQENRLSVVYWEGAVLVEGNSRGRPVIGVGYVELTGYERPMEGGF